MELLRHIAALTREGYSVDFQWCSVTRSVEIIVREHAWPQRSSALRVDAMKLEIYPKDCELDVLDFISAIEAQARKSA